MASNLYLALAGQQGAFTTAGSEELASLVGYYIINVFHAFCPLCRHTGESIGVEYLFAQTGRVLEDMEDDPEVLQEEEEEEEPEAEGEEDEEGEGDEGHFQEYLYEMDSLEGPIAPESAASNKEDTPSEAEQVNDCLTFLRQLCGSQYQST